MNVVDGRGQRIWNSLSDRMRGTGFYAEQMAQMYQISRRKAGFPPNRRAPLNTEAFRVPTDQLSLF